MKNISVKLKTHQFVICLFALTIIVACNLNDKTQTTQITNADGVCAKEILSTSEIFPPDTDNKPFEFPKPLIDSTLLRKIIDMAIAGKIKTYKNYNDSVPLSKEQLNCMFKLIVDTVEVEMPNSKDREIKIVTTNPIDFISKIQFKEDWIYDDVTGNITKQVVAYSLSMDTNDEHCKPNGSKSMFWVKNVKTLN